VATSAAHVGWVLGKRATRRTAGHPRPDALPELLWLNRWHWTRESCWPGCAGASSYLVTGSGWSGLLVGFVLSTVLLYHATFMINSLAHVFGSRR